MPNILTSILCTIASVLALSGCSAKTDMSQDAQALRLSTSQTGVLHRGYAVTRFGQVHYRAFSAEPNSIAAPPVMALHLSPNSGQVFSSFLPLIGADRTAIAPDYPGYGMSDAIAGPQRIEDYATAMLDVIDELNMETPIDLIGYHTGAGVALEMAKQKPDMIGRILLVAVPILTPQERAAGAALPPIPFDIDGEFAKKEWQNSWSWRGPGQDVKSVYATFSEKMRPSARILRVEAILAYDIDPVFKAATHEMMIVNVKDDLWTATQRARDLRPDAAYAEFAQYGHGLFHVAPQEMSDLARDFFETK